MGRRTPRSALRTGAFAGSTRRGWSRSPQWRRTPGARRLPGGIKEMAGLGHILASQAARVGGGMDDPLSTLNRFGDTGPGGEVPNVSPCAWAAGEDPDLMATAAEVGDEVGAKGPGAPGHEHGGHGDEFSDVSLRALLGRLLVAGEVPQAPPDDSLSRRPAITHRRRVSAPVLPGPARWRWPNGAEPFRQRKGSTTVRVGAPSGAPTTGESPLTSGYLLVETRSPLAGPTRRRPDRH
jgi:hypothetical protein